MSASPFHRVTMSVRQNLQFLGVLPSSKMLVGVSGGIDSMVLLHILRSLEYNVSAGHVNFNLRGTESLNDEIFVRKWCVDHDIPFYTLSKDTKSYATEHKLGTQEAARDIRYAWWAELVHHHEFDFVATAHHLDDTIETMLLNLFRGTGFRGLTGIPKIRELYIRPLLDCSREDISAYAEAFDIPFRTDESNATDHYQRNKVRHHLVPLLQEMYPGWHTRMKHTLHRLNTEWNTWQDAYEDWRSRYVVAEKDGFLMDADDATLAFKLRWLEEKGIPWPLAFDFMSSAASGSGVVLRYQQYSLYRTDTGHYLEETPTPLHIRFDHPGHYDLGDFTLSMERVPAEEWSDHQNPFVEFINETVVRWPLEVRTIQPGDRFQPLGMAGKTKKLQDFLVDLKMEMHEKQHQLLFANPDHILWVIGLRLDERAKVSASDRHVYRISFTRNRQ